MTVFPYRTFPVSENLADVSAYLRQQGVEHRFTEAPEGQTLWLAHAEHVALLDAFFEAYQQQDIHIEKTTAIHGEGLNFWFKKTQPFLAELKQAPLTALCIVLGFVGLLLTEYLNNLQLFQCCFYLPLNEILATGKFWQMLTPTFLHFGWMHWLFNCLWLWILGRMLESYLSFVLYLLLFLVIALAANVIQYISSGVITFGGLSGVVYGYFGFVFVAKILKVDARLYLPDGMFIFMGIMLCAGFFGVFETLFSVHVANWAHFGGMVAGAIMAGVYFNGTLRRRLLRK